MSVWTEVGDRVFTRRYAFYDQNIGAILGDDGVLIVDTRISHRQADEILADLTSLTALPVRAVVNTHGHNDHAFGNHRFRPAPIWGHARCRRMIRDTGKAQIAKVAEAIPSLAEELAEVVLDPPDRTFDSPSTTVDFDAGGRRIELRYLGRAHTDNDVVVLVPDADVLFAATSSRTGRRPSSATATRWNGRRRSRRWSSSSPAPSCRATATSTTRPSSSARWSSSGRSRSWRRW
jgi:glyoxylase-like metal-dependent hydrolase (beta-lactamase superfamily II)